MNIPDLHSLLQRLAWIPLDALLVVFLFTGGVLLLVRDWRASIGALVLQYLTMGFVLARLVRPEIAYAKVLVGLFVCLMLYLSARQASWRHRLTFGSHGLRALLGTRAVGGEVFPPGRTFRLMAALLMAVTAFSLAPSYPIPGLPASVATGVYWLALVGLLLLVLTENPLKVGQGLLTAITGFELWYTTLERSLLVVGLWGVVNFLLALVVGYLVAVRGVNLEEDF